MKSNERLAPPAQRIAVSTVASAAAASSNTEKKVATFLKGLKNKTLRGLFPGPQDRLKPTPFPYTPDHHDIQHLQAAQKILDGVWVARSERGMRPATVMWPHVEGFGKQWQAEEFHCIVHIVHPSDAVRLYKDRTREDMLVAQKSFSAAQEALFMRIVPYHAGDVRAAGNACQVDYEQLLVMRDWAREAPRWDGAQSEAGEPAAPVLIVAESAYDGSVASLALLLAAKEGELAQETRSRLLAGTIERPEWKEAFARFTPQDFAILNRILSEG
jgi:hypothetical protein